MEVSKEVDPRAWGGASGAGLIRISVNHAGAKNTIFEQTCRSGFSEGKCRAALGRAPFHLGLDPRLTSDFRGRRGRHDLRRARRRGHHAPQNLRDRLQNRDRRRSALPEDALR